MMMIPTLREIKNDNNNSKKKQQQKIKIKSNFDKI